MALTRHRRGEPVHVLIEIPAWSFRKTVATSSGWRQEFFSLLPCPFNYGAAPDIPAPDGEGQDVIVLGPRLERGAQVTVYPRLRVVFWDEGVSDDKLVARLDGRSPRQIDRLLLMTFFRMYTVLKRVRGFLHGRKGDTRVLGYEPYP